jgi:hypothetical protein
MIKSITDLGNGVIEIVGNFKPRGRYKYVNLWKNTIVNWDEVTNIFDIELKPYFCTRCKKTHKNGAIFDAHIEYMGKKEDLIPCDRIVEADISKLSSIGRKQLDSLMNRLKWNPKKADLYRQEINKLFIYEGATTEEILPKDEQL